MPTMADAFFDDDEVPARLDKVGPDVSQVGEGRGWAIGARKSIGIVGSAVAPMFREVVQCPKPGVSSLELGRTVTARTPRLQFWPIPGRRPLAWPRPLGDALSSTRRDLGHLLANGDEEAI